MAPQSSIPISATILGLIGTILWSIQLLPQIWHSYRSKNTEGVPSMMMLCWSCSTMPFAVYAICQNFNIPLWIQPQFFGLFCMISWGQVKVYSRKWPTWKSCAACMAMLALNAGCQVTFVLILRPRFRRGLDWPIFLFGLLATLCLISGYLPVPFELLKRRGRITGISLWFLLIDCAGAFFSLMSLAAQHTFDPLFGTLYAVCATVELGMFVSHGIWMLRTRGMRKRAKEVGLPYDGYPEAIEWQRRGIKFTWRGISMSRRSDAERGDGMDMDVHGAAA